MNSSARQSSPSVTRRLVLGGAGAAVGLLFVTPSAQAAGATDSGPGLQVLPPGEEAWVATGPATQARIPAVLGARLRVGTRQGAGTVVQLSWDRRLYTQTLPRLVGDDGRELAVRALGRPVTDSLGQTTVRVRVAEALVEGRDYLLSLGARRPLRYPHDVVEEPLPIRVTVGDGAAAGSRRSLGGTGTTSGALWGACIGAGWEELAWGDRFHSWVPALVTVRATGPGAVPAGSVVGVDLDARLVHSMTVEGLDGTVLARSRRGPGGLVVARWNLAEPLPAGERVSVRVVPRSAGPIGSLPGLQAPTVSLRAAKASPAQRTTGQESVTRDDSAYDEESVAAHGRLALLG